MDEIFDNPRRYYMLLAEGHERMRNFDQALALYSYALQFAPDDGEIHARIEHLQGLLAG
jgi:hypothetical protein